MSQKKNPPRSTTPANAMQAALDEAEAKKLGLTVKQLTQARQMVADNPSLTIEDAANSILGTKNALVVMSPQDKAYAALWGLLYYASYRLGSKCVIPGDRVTQRRLTFGPRQMGRKQVYVAPFDMDVDGETRHLLARALTCAIHKPIPGKAYDCLVWEIDGEWCALPWIVAGSKAVKAYNIMAEPSKRLIPEDEDPVYELYEGQILFVGEVQSEDPVITYDGGRVRKVRGVRYEGKSVMLLNDSVVPDPGAVIFSLPIGERMETFGAVWARVVGAYTSGADLRPQLKQRAPKTVAHMSKVPNVPPMDALGVTINRFDVTRLASIIDRLGREEPRDTHPTVKAIMAVGWTMPRQEGERRGLVMTTLVENVRPSAEVEQGHYRADMVGRLTSVFSVEQARAATGIGTDVPIWEARKRFGDFKFKRPVEDDPMLAWMRGNGAADADFENPTALQVRKDLLQAAEKLITCPLVDLTVTFGEAITVEAWAFLQPRGNTPQAVRGATAEQKGKEDGGTALTYLNQRRQHHGLAAIEIGTGRLELLAALDAAEAALIAVIDPSAPAPEAPATPPVTEKKPRRSRKGRATGEIQQAPGEAPASS